MVRDGGTSTAELLIGLRFSAAMAVYKDDRWSEYDYWTFDQTQEDYTQPEQHWIEKVHSVLLDSIAIRRQAGGTIGSLMSGGLDTGIITATLARSLPGGSALPVFCITFVEKKYDDAELRETMCRACPLLQLHAKTLTPGNFADMLQSQIAHFDKPVNDVAFAGMSGVCIGAGGWVRCRVRWRRFGRIVLHRARPRRMEIRTLLAFSAMAAKECTAYTCSALSHWDFLFQAICSLRPQTWDER
jgi:Asparagine synthase